MTISIIYFLLTVTLTSDPQLPPQFSGISESPECAEPEFRTRLYQRFPSFLHRQRSLEFQAAQYLGSHSQGILRSADYTLPVVFHVIHQNGTENISDAQIITALEHLNDAFANNNFYGGAVGVEVPIRFCLARRNPEGNATTGINRVVSPLTEVTFATDIVMKDLSRWDPSEYINIWLVRKINDGGIGGYAYLPGAHGRPYDGVVMLGARLPPLGSGHSILVHEMGHYFGLYHTFEGGCTNNDCLLDGDRVCDTPPDNTTAPPGDCSAEINSCSTDALSGFSTDQNDLNWNYMDYGNLPCQNGFTQGQSDRMVYFLENVRHSLLQSLGCEDPCLLPVVAGFTASSTVVNIGDPVQFTNTSSGSSVHTWLINGVPFSSDQHASYTFNTLGEFNVVLIAENADPNCQDSAVIAMEVICPVAASFTSGELYPEIGASVSFANTSSGASVFQWFVDGVIVSSNTNLSYQFHTAGQYRVCLTADNGLCEERFCQLIFALDKEAPIDCNETFVTAYGSTFPEEGRRIVAVPEGWIFTAAKPDSLIIGMLDDYGNLQWQQSMRFIANRTERTLALLLTDNETIIGCGNSNDGTSDSWNNFVFHYDYKARSLLWGRVFNFAATDRSIFGGLLELPNGNILITGDTWPNSAPGLGCDALWMEINPSNASVVNRRSFNLGSCETYFSPILMSDGISVVTTGRNNFDGGGFARMRQHITRLALNGNMFWSKLYLRNVISHNARLYGVTIIEENGLIAFGYGDITGISAANVTLQMFKTDLQGNLQWARSYDIPGAQNEVVVKAISVPDGFLMTGNYLSVNNKIFLIKTDKQGAVQWAKAYSGVGAETVSDIAYRNGRIFLFGTTNSFGNGNTDVLLIKTDLFGEIGSDACAFGSDINLVVTVLQNPYEGLHPLTPFTRDFPSAGIMPPQSTPHLLESQLCFTPCIDTCYNGIPVHTTPDAVLQNVSAFCADGNIVVELTICNGDSIALPGNTPVSVYLGNPTLSPASLITTEHTRDTIWTDQCVVMSLTLSLPLGLEIVAVVNDDGSLSTPFSLHDDFPTTSIPECDYTNNIFSFTIDNTPLLLTLGPDRVVCHFEVTVLDAGDGFINYQWSVPGFDEQTFSVYEPGTYSVTVTDLCGDTHTASVSLTEFPASIIDIGMDTASVCPGGSISFEVSGFAEYQWFPADLVDCPSCPTISVTPSNDTCLIVVATDGNGCYSVDTVCIILTPLPETYDTVMFCPGDTVWVFGDPVAALGTYTQTFLSGGGCDSTHSVTLIAGDTVLIERSEATCENHPFEFFGHWLDAPGVYEHFDTSGDCTVRSVLALEVLQTYDIHEGVMLCQGETAEVFGMPVDSAGVFTGVFITGAGCDSIHTIEVFVLDTIHTQSSLRICGDEMADVFGTPTNVPGVYTAVFSAVHGCDSVHTIILSAYEAYFISDTAAICSGDSALIFGTWIMHPGTYKHHLKSVDGCDSILAITLHVSEEIKAGWHTFPPCPEMKNGAIEVLASGGLPPFEYAWSTGITSVSANHSGIAVGSYSVTITDQAGCTSVHSIDLEEILPPEYEVVVSPVTCYGSYDGIVTVTGNGDLFVSFDGGLFTNQFQYPGLAPGIWPVAVMDSATCIWETEITIDKPELVFVRLPDDVTIQQGDTFGIHSITSQHTLEYLWNPAHWLSCDNCPTPSAYPQMTTMYLLTVVDSFNCLAADSILITVLSIGVTVPSIFSPNGDGVNDLFYPMGRGIDEILVMRIFDRWGNVAYEQTGFPANDPAYGWDGIFLGKPVNPGVFVYYIEARMRNGSIQRSAGDITLIR